MVEFLNNNILWWYWIVMGLIFMILEVLDGQFIIFGLGVSSIIVGIIKLLFPSISFTILLFMWGILSLSIFIFLQKYRHAKRMERIKKEDKKYQMIGIVTEEIKDYGEGRVMFEEPLIGSKEWKAIAEKNIPKGAKVKIVNISGQIIKVKEVE